MRRSLFRRGDSAARWRSSAFAWRGLIRRPYWSLGIPLLPRSQIFSKTAAMPWPPPMHMVTSA